MKNIKIQSLLIVSLVLLAGSVCAEDTSPAAPALNNGEAVNSLAEPTVAVETPQAEAAVAEEPVTAPIVAESIATPESGYDSAGVSEPVNADAVAERTAPQARRRHEFKVGVERYTYRYNEIVDDSHFMHSRGYFTGYFGTYTFRPADTDSIYSEILNVFRFELRYACGTTDYDGGNGAGPLIFKGMKDYTYEFRGLTGKEFELDRDLTLMPYIGIASRYLFNGAEAIPGGGYNRESQYYYVPIGLETRLGLPYAWGVVSTIEYDFFARGHQKSHLEDITGAGFEVINNAQHKGFGFRGDLSIVKELAHTRIGFGPFYRYWHIQDSNIAPFSQNGVIIGGGVEPNNVTKEFGLKMDVAF
ncbi:MAG: hypothetical protein WCI27_06900 [Candidatus Omnitrophota bacterium]